MLANLLVLGALFFLLVPGVLVSLPRGGSKYTVAFVHAIVFVLVYVAAQNVGDYLVYDEEGFKSRRSSNTSGTWWKSWK
jgi:hypothetical protein